MLNLIIKNGVKAANAIFAFNAVVRLNGLDATVYYPMSHKCETTFGDTFSIRPEWSNTPA